MILLAFANIIVFNIKVYLFLSAEDRYLCDSLAYINRCLTVNSSREVWRFDIISVDYHGVGTGPGGIPAHIQLCASGAGTVVV